MAIDLDVLGQRIHEFRERLGMSIAEVADATGIPESHLKSFEARERKPTGDELLILADFLKCDYQALLDSKVPSRGRNTNPLFRRFGKDFSKEDRWAVEEFLFLAECEEFLLQELKAIERKPFVFQKRGDFFKAHANEAAKLLRQHLGYSPNELPRDIYRDFRRIGIHLFRRELKNSNVSGLFISHPSAGDCVLVNYVQDVYRQRFTAAHEAAHAIFDVRDGFVVSFEKGHKDELVEVRANRFASQFLMPPEFLKAIRVKAWDRASVLKWANEIRVNPEALVYALTDADLLPRAAGAALKRLQVPGHQKVDPELPIDLSPRTRESREILLKRGLSVQFVELCFGAYEKGIISAARAAEMLLADESELSDIAKMFGVRLTHGD